MDNLTGKKDGKVEGKFKIIGNWEDQSKKLKEKFPQLTTMDLKYEPNKEDELISRLETRLNKTRSEVISIIMKDNAAYL